MSVEGGPRRSALTVGRLAVAAGPLLLVAFLVNCTIVAVAVQAVNVPGDNEMIDFPVLVFASIGPVLGNCIGFLLAYRRPSRASLVGFLAPGIVITAVFVVLAVQQLAEHDDIGVMVTALLVTVAPTAVAVAGLLRRRATLLGTVGAGPPIPGGYVPAGLRRPADVPAPGQVVDGQPAAAGVTAEWDLRRLGPAGPAGPPGRTGEWSPDQLGPPGAGGAPPGTAGQRGHGQPAEQAGTTAKWNLDDLAAQSPEDRPPGGRR